MTKGDKLWFNKYVSEHKIKRYKNGNNEEIKNERSDMIITREYPSMYYLHIPYVKDVKKYDKKDNVIAIDPGVRTFHATYDPSGKIGKLGDKLADSIKNKYTRLDELISEITKTNVKNNDYGYIWNKKQRQNIRKRCAWLRTKIKNIVNDNHWKIASYYCKNYQYIVIPKLNTESIKKSIRKTYGYKKGSPMIRRMMVLSHSKFIDRLMYKARV